MSEAILSTDGRRLLQVWISADLNVMIERFIDRQDDMPTRAEAIRRLIALGLADDCLYRDKRGRK